MSNTKRVYTFGNGKAEGKAEMKNLLGGKGANLAEMNLIGVPVPPGFTITTDVCNEYFEKGKDNVVAELKPEVEAAMAGVEELMKSKFGDVENPLLVSVRSGARASMPGMMDTILNLGLNDTVVEGLIRKTGRLDFQLGVEPSPRKAGAGQRYLRSRPSGGNCQSPFKYLFYRRHRPP